MNLLALEWAACLLWKLECLACAGAVRLSEGTMCPKCQRNLPEFAGEICRLCGKPFPSAPGPRRFSDARSCGECLRKKPPFQGMRSFGPYEGALRGLVHAFKYQADGHAGKILGGLLLRAAERRPDFLRTDAVAYVPSHWTRRLARGFVPARELALRLGRGANLPVARLLSKRRMTRSQVELPWKARMENVRGAFAATRSMKRRRPATVLLVDDVFTTGATMRACARALRKGGAKTIFAVTAARTLPGRARDENRRASRALDAAASVGL